METVPGEDFRALIAIEQALTAANPDERYIVGRGARALTLLQPLLATAPFDRVKQRVAS